MPTHLVLASVATAGGKVITVKDTNSGAIYGLPVGTVAAGKPGADSTHYNLMLTHPLFSIEMAIGTITTIGGVAPNGTNILTDFASLMAIMP